MIGEDSAHAFCGGDVRGRSMPLARCSIQQTHIALKESDSLLSRTTSRQRFLNLKESFPFPKCRMIQQNLTDTRAVGRVRAAPGRIPCQIDFLAPEVKGCFVSLFDLRNRYSTG
jgi:hypothetical protein